MSSLEASFSNRVIDAIQQSHALGYHPARFEQMVHELGAVNTAKTLVRSGALQDGLARLRSLGRLDISVEAIMLNPEFTPLFSKGELDAARWHLDTVKQLDRGSHA